MIEFDEADVAAIRAELGIDEPEIVEGSFPVEAPAPKRRRGRPPSKKSIVEEAAEKIVPPTLTKRDEKQVAERLANMLAAATGMGGVVKAYLPMTDDEAKAIAEPLASYLVRNADTFPVAQQVLENYDLAAIVLGVGAYTVRVYRDRQDELETVRASNNSTLARISEYQAGNDGRGPDEGDSYRLSVAPFKSSEPSSGQF